MKRSKIINRFSFGILHSLFLFYVIICLLSLFLSCSKKEFVPDSEFVSYINAYTGGLVSSSSTIRIELVNGQADVESGSATKEKLFSFSPSIKGKAYWLDNRTIEFVPDKGALKNGETYQAQFKLGKVISVDKRHEIFHFSFAVEEKSIEILVRPVNISDPALATVTGEIHLNEKFELDLIQKAFQVQMGDKQALSPEIEATGDAHIFRFLLRDIPRKKTDIDLEITVDGTVLGIDKIVSQTLNIPALNVFKVLSTELISEPENGVRITFSYPLSTTQDLRGLIIIPELSNYTTQLKDNIVAIYFDRSGKEKITVNVDKGIKNTQGEKMEETFSKALSLEILKPQVEILKSGSIIPHSNNLTLPFRAVNLSAVDLKIIQIYENNILPFLQRNTLNGSYELRRAGRMVYKKTIRLDNPSSPKLQDWQNYSIDLSKIIRQDPGSIYRIELSFKQSYSTYSCDKKSEKTVSEDASEMVTPLDVSVDEREENYWDSPYPEYDNSDYDWELYDWEERNNPCHPSYYMLSERKASRNVIMSDIGVIAKTNSAGKWWVAVSNLLDTKPVSGVDITFYNYQLQAVASAKTDVNGFAVVESKGKLFALVASANGQKTYLRLVEGEDNSLSRFDVGGKIIEKGLRGYIYGERGVWRPGDTLHVTFILYDLEKKIPENHPVSLEVYNSQGQFFTKQILTKGVNGFYTFHIPTPAEAPTGLWNAYIKIGGTSFHKSFRIETIKPNRLKINLALTGKHLDASSGSVPASLTSSWLTGATAHGLEVKVEMTLSKASTQFEGYENYIFNNPATDFSFSQSELFNGTLNNEGSAKFDMKMPYAGNAPGMLNANIVCRVFEPGGDASIYTENIPFSPFVSYVGLNLNQEKDKYIETDTDHRFQVVTVNADGKPVDRDNLEYRIYKIGWSWWWENNNEAFSNYISNSSFKPVVVGKLKTINGKTGFNFNLQYPDWGRFLVYVKDKDSGHAVGGTVYIDWPMWRGRSNKTDPDGIKMLTFSTDKSSYETGEDVTVIIPASAGGNALVVLENGSTVLKREWVRLSGQEDTKYVFKAAPAMSPNFYVHISLLQPHAQTVNDLPIRMYGVVPVFISNKESVLNPQINMPDVLRPETEFTVEVSEKEGKPMTYTLAVVDDGLLDLTNFKTPNPWSEFYAREALGIRTWDMFDDVLGAFGGKYSALFSVGGDEDMKLANTKANRFKPVVKYLGPFALNKGEKKKHKITLPVYVGSVRTMIVAGQDGAYGKAEKTTPVRSPLMLLSSLPRVVSTNEEISLPVNIFAMENSVKNVSVKVETNGLLQIAGENNQSIRFTKPGDEMMYFRMRTTSKTGVGKVTVTASGGGKISKETIEIDVRNPNPAVILSEYQLLDAGKTGNFNYRITGTSDDDWVKLEVSRIPSVDIVRRLDFLYNYGNYCSEQLTSTALPLLYITQFKDVDNVETETIKKNIREAIRSLYGRQLSNGGIVYWPGQNQANEWITSYAGSFLVLAKEKGFEVNEGVLNRWKAYQSQEARNWSPAPVNDYIAKESTFQQAFRLYSLALADAPELGAMNRLKETKDLFLQSRWLLATAYALSGKMQPAEELIFNISSDIAPYYSSYTYGSSERDESLILQALIEMGRMDAAFKQAQKIAKKLSKQTYFDTQSTAFALMSMGNLAEKISGTLEFNWTLNGKNQDEVKSGKASYQIQLPSKADEGNLSITNKGRGSLYVNLVSKSRPINDTFPSVANNLHLDVSYADLSGKTINVSKIKQGTDFTAIIKVSNISAVDDYTDLALTHIIPSGWEIFNERMTSGDNVTASDVYTYRDVRDDRVLTYFDLPRGKAKVFKVRLQASYAGSFVLPAIACEAMYNTSAQARTQASRVVVIQ
ncbi:MAG: alpha-2-macroglobulin [Dysgonamonadaceae bacterium]|jgi:uncharacterized protein YfaS (alpha-2-macroglobulin family)|nr:alpha-2-macroglobulin [Dysgonamonadaceae bacterium]